MVKLKVSRIAVLAEEIDNPLLLLGSKQFLATVITIISLVTAKIILYLVTYRCLVLAFYLVEDSVETIRSLYLANLLEMHTAIVTQGCWKDRESSCHLLWNRFARQVPYALIGFRAAVKETERP